MMKSADEKKRRQAKKQATQEMERVARKGVTITYSELVDRIKALTYRPTDRDLSNLLSDISRKTHTNRGVLLSAVVVRKAGEYKGDALPGDGFFYLAKSLGLEVTDREAFHTSALSDVHASYAQPEA